MKLVKSQLSKELSYLDLHVGHFWIYSRAMDYHLNIQRDILAWTKLQVTKDIKKAEILISAFFVVIYSGVLASGCSALKDIQ